MPPLLHFLFFVLSCAIVWLFSGFLVDAVDRVARRFHQSGFTIAFFVLGLMTSISEISVMVNATLDGTPQVSAGNLSGASFVILMLIVPLLAIASNGIGLSSFIRKGNFALALGVIALPALFLADGHVTMLEGVAAISCYMGLLYCIRQQHIAPADMVEKVQNELVGKHATLRDIGIIVAGALSILLAGHSLVEESVYFAGMIGIPPSIIGLLVLSIGTNVPEIVVAVRSVKKHHADIAFGDYIGSAVANTLIFGILALVNGGFSVEYSEFLYTFFFMMVSFIVLYTFAESNNTLSRREGVALLSMYLLFLAIQLMNVIQHL